MNPHLDVPTLNLYLDDALETHARVNADAHLRQCAMCRAELEQLRGVLDAFQVWRSEPIPRDITPAVMARVSQRPAPHPRARWGIAILAAQMALAALLLAWALPLVVDSLTRLTMPALSVPAFEWNEIFFAVDLAANVKLLLPSVAIWVWAVVLIGSIVFWVVGNRLALSILNGNPEASQ